MKTTQPLLLSLALVLCACSIVLAQGSRDRSTKKMVAAAEQSSHAARVFNEIMGTRDKSIPQDLLDKAEAVAVSSSGVSNGAVPVAVTVSFSGPHRLSDGGE